MRGIVFFFGLIFVLVLFPASGVSAQNPEEEDDEPRDELYTGEEVVVRGRRKNESLDDPSAFVERIDVEAYEGRFTTVAELLKRATGVRVRDFGGLGRTQTVSIRGSNPDQVVVMVDGMPLNPAGGGATDLSLIPLEQVESIEIIRGGSSALRGSGAMGGVVNIITKKAGRKPATTLYTSYGSFNTFETRVSHSRGGENWRALAAGNFLHSDGDFPYIDDRGTEFNTKDDREDKRRNNGVDSRSFLLKAGGTVGALDISAQNSLTVSDRGQPGLVTFPTPHVRRRDTQNIMGLSAFLSGPTPWMSITAKGYYRYLATRYADPYGEQTGVPRESVTAEHAPTGETDLDFLISEDHLLTLGGGGGEERLEDRDRPDRRRGVANLHARHKADFFHRRLVLIPALRFDWVEGVGEQLSPKLGMKILPRPWLTVQGNLARSFRAPSFTELYAEEGLQVGNLDLKPERAFSADAGAQVRTRELFLEAVYFHQEVEDLIEYVLVSGFRYKPFNIGSVRVRGGEFSGSLRPCSWAEASGNATITYAIDTTGEPNRDGIQIPGRPRYMANAGLKIGPKRLYGTLEYNYVGENYLTFAGTKLIPERHLWNAALVGRPEERLTLGAEVKNLRDERAQDLRGLPLPGRAWFGTARLSF